MIGVIIFLVCWCKKKKRPPLHDRKSDTITTSRHDLNDLTDHKIELETENYQKEKTELETHNVKKVTILLVTTSQTRIEIKIDPEKTVKELIQFYFEKINRPELYGDPNIRFLSNAKLLSHDSNDLIKTYLSKTNKEKITIVVDDLEDKIKIVFVNN